MIAKSWPANRPSWKECRFVEELFQACDLLWRITARSNAVCMEPAKCQRCPSHQVGVITATYSYFHTLLLSDTLLLLPGALACVTVCGMHGGATWRVPLVTLVISPDISFMFPGLEGQFVPLSHYRLMRDPANEFNPVKFKHCLLQST